jgi:DNA modification methylase
MSEGLTILTGDWIERLRELPDEHFHCVVTSPPYWNLRDYKVPGQLGLEKTPEEYIAKIVEGFRQVWRVLRKDGTLWLNLGDSCLKKQLVGIPWRVALALQANGWYLRAENIWNKPNPMPECVRDRPSRCHEQVFLLTKRPRYFYDIEAVKEPVTGTAHPRGNGVNPKARENGKAVKQNGSFSAAVTGLVAKRNWRSVWTVKTAAYKGAHFATFPPKLVEPCILASTSEIGCCPKCGAPWVRLTAKGEPLEEWKRKCGADRNGEYHGNNQKRYQEHKAQPASTVKARILAGMVERVTVGWKLTCKCAIEKPVPCRVMDTFGGSGTTADVALKNGREATILELNPEYVELAKARCAQPAPRPKKRRSTPASKPQPIQPELLLAL